MESYSGLLCLASFTQQVHPFCSLSSFTRFTHIVAGISVTRISVLFLYGELGPGLVLVLGVEGGFAYISHGQKCGRDAILKDFWFAYVCFC
jgi:hypothetical protein